MRGQAIQVFSLLAWVITGLCMSGCGKDYSPPIPELVDFNFDVRPVLVQKCYLCHGPDGGSRKAGLRFDTFEGATAALKDGGRAIVPGNPGDSRLIARIHQTDPELIMPPPDSKLKLTEREIEVLTKWIKQGATWKQHWAFIPPMITDVPKDQNPIDFFIDEKIEKSGLEAGNEANKNSLIRRVSYELTGLPPAAKDIRRYLADNGADAYEKMVDHYLNSPRFGETWARHWMDIARYAETKGHEFDYTITGAWQYRDYLIRAYNKDIPYDQLVKEQLAGDLLATPRRNPDTGINESKIGTAFCTLSEGKHSPVDIRQEEADQIDNIIDVTSKAFQGLTVSCARCHDHKFDPISAADYYSFYGIMEGTRYSPVPAGLTLDNEQSIEEIRKIDSFIRKTVAGKWKEEIKGMVHTPNDLRGSGNEGDTTTHRIIGDFRGGDLGGWNSDGLAFGIHSTLGDPSFNENYEIVELAQGKASSRSAGMRIFGALRSPDFTIDRNFIGVRARGMNSTIRIIIDNFQLISFPIYGQMDQKVNNIEDALKKKNAELTALLKQVKKDTSAKARAAEIEGAMKKTQADLVKARKADGQNFVFDVSLWKGHKAYVDILPGIFLAHVYSLPKDAFIETEYVFAFNDKWKDPPIQNDSIFMAEQAVDNWASHSATPAQVSWINGMLKRKLLQRQFAATGEVLTKRNKLSTSVADTVFVNGVADGFAINSPVFIRGNPRELTEPVPRRFLSAITPKDSVFHSAGSGRLELATAMVNKQNPLTARVMVNRIWYHLFGKGIVETVDNFGLQGKLPSHPELLDFLAVRFQADGWSTKKMIKLIMMSGAFKRSVDADPAADKVDPDNLLLTHYPRLRLEAEQIRDGILAVSGRLDTAMYGPPVQMHITAFMQGRGKPKDSGPLDGKGRRSIYQEVRRNFLESMMMTFDRPIPFTAFGRRNVTNVPAQSLILMNDPFVLQQAEVMAQSVVGMKNLSMDDRFKWIYVRSFSREPTAAETTKAKEFVSQLAKLYDVDEAHIMDSFDVWKDYCHSIFNSKEFIYLI